MKLQGKILLQVISSEVEGDKFTGFVGPQKMKLSASAEGSLTSLDVPQKVGKLLAETTCYQAVWFKWY